MNTKTCILLFSRTSASESKHKQLASLEKTNYKIHQSFLNRTLRTVHKTGLPVIKVDERGQIGDSFGARFYNAIAHAFESGYEHVITVGADCPSLYTQDILHAEKELLAGRQCLGPSKDGGVYLLGISKVFFHQDFLQLTWQTDQLFQDLLFYFDKHQVSVVNLSEKLDVDNATQFNVISHLLSQQVDFAFLNDIFSVVQARQIVFLFNPLLLLETLQHRGPPMLFSAA